jgi:hypothetical protein
VASVLGIKRLSWLRRLDLTTCDLHDANLLRWIEHLPRLQELKLTLCQRLTAEGVARIASLRPELSIKR